MVLLLTFLLASSFQTLAMNQVLESDCVSFTLQNDSYHLSLTQALQGARVSTSNGYYHVGFVPASTLCNNEHIFISAGATNLYNVTLCTKHKIIDSWSVNEDYYYFLEHLYEKLDITDLCSLLRTRRIEANALLLHQQTVHMTHILVHLNQQIKDVLKTFELKHQRMK